MNAGLGIWLSEEEAGPVSPQVPKVRRRAGTPRGQKNAAQSAQLKASLDAGPTGDLAFIVFRRGTPSTRHPINKGALSAAFVEAAKGIKGKSAHGLGKAAATRTAKNRATEPELESYFWLVRPENGDSLYQKC
jgi:hypothetical protein